MYSQIAMSACDNTVEILKAAGEPSRLRILKVLQDGELCACHFVALLDVSQPTVSRHVAVLRRAGLVLERRDGKWSHYRLAGDDSPAGPLLRMLAATAEQDPVVRRDRARARAFRKMSPAQFCAGDRGGCC